MKQHRRQDVEKQRQPEDGIANGILACLAAMDPKPVEMNGIFEQLKRQGVCRERLMFAFAVAALEERALIYAALDTPEMIGLALTPAGREHIGKFIQQACGLTMDQMQEQVRKAVEQAVAGVNGGKAPRVC